MVDKQRAERRLKLHELRVLMSVAQTGSMSKAAKTLATSQPAVSRAIADLEHSLGVRLFDRDPHGIVPTAYGQALLKRTVAMFDELKLGLNDIQSLADPDAGEVRVAAAVALVTGFAPAVIETLNRQYPRIVCRMTTLEAGAVLRMLEDREVDVAMLFRISEADVTGMDAQPLFDHNPIVVVTGEKNALCRRRNLRLADLMNEPWALTRPESPFSYSYVFREAGLDPPLAAVIADSLPLRLALAARGQFLTLTSAPILRFVGKDTPLKVLPVRVQPSRYQTALLTLKNRTLTAAAQRFIQCAREVAKRATA